MIKHLPCLLFAIACLSTATAEERPNILWITSEDNAAHWLGCYGNSEAATPRLDALAQQGLMFTRAYANGPVCAVARSTILNGAHAVTQGTQHMRSRHPIPPDFVGHATHLRRSGYYCTNNNKTDYNFRGNDGSIWDESSGKAHYRKRPDGKPFFAIFNLQITHESQLFPQKVATNRKDGTIPESPRLDPAKLTVPPHLPDLPEVRNDIAIYHDCMSAMDRQVGKLLDELAAAGLTEDTIVFYYSDHGGAMARGKRYLHDTGTRVPLIVHVPEKWRHLSPFAPGGKVDEPVSFVDLAPTLLSLCGLPTPAVMQGRAFLGGHRRAPAPDDMVFLYADRFDELEGMRRGVTDGRWRYIRCFTAQLAGAPYSVYPLGQPSWRAWRDAARDGRLKKAHQAIWQAPQPVEMLYDITADPWEMNNLAADPTHSKRLTDMREKLREMMSETRDTSVVPEPMWADLRGDGTIHDYVRSSSFDHPTVLDLAFTASAGDATNLPRFSEALRSEHPAIRFWAAHGCLVLGKDAAPAIPALTQCLDDPQPLIRIVAAEALIAAGKPDAAKQALAAALDLPMSAECYEWLTNALKRAGMKATIPAGRPAHIPAKAE